MSQVTRDSSLKIPKQIKVYEKNSNSINDTIAVKKAIATSNDEKLDIPQNKE